MVKRCAFLTMANTTGHDIDDALAIEPLRALGWQTEEVVWSAHPASYWADFDLVVVRSTWDYATQLHDFIHTLNAVDDATTLANPLSTIRWNLDKIYLRELATQGIPTIATLWGEASPLKDLMRARMLWDADLIIKPRLGAGSAKLHRIRRDAWPLDDATATALDADHGAGGYLIQPYLPEVAEAGEISLFYFNGAYTHAVRKVPRPGDFRSQEEFGSTLEAITSTPLHREVAQATLDAAPGPLLYARIDLVPYADEVAVIECEVTEPALYFRFAPGSSDRFARALDAWWSAHADPAPETS